MTVHLLCLLLYLQKPPNSGEFFQVMRQVFSSCKCWVVDNLWYPASVYEPTNEQTSCIHRNSTIFISHLQIGRGCCERRKQSWGIRTPLLMVISVDYYYYYFFFFLEFSVILPFLSFKIFYYFHGILFLFLLSRDTKCGLCMFTHTSVRKYVSVMA